MKKYILLTTFLLVVFFMMPQKTQAQTYTHLDPYTTYRMSNIYNTTIGRGKNSRTAEKKTPAKSKEVELELKNNKIRKEMTQKEFLTAVEVGKKYFSEANLDKAQIIFEGLAEIDSGDVDINASVQESLGIIFFIKKDYDKALSHLNEGLDRNNRMANAMIFRAKIYMMQEKYYNAEADLEFLLEVTLKNKNNDIIKEANKMLNEVKKHIYK